MKLFGAGGTVSAGDNVASAGGPAGNGADGTDAGLFADNNVGARLVGS